jgi:hypothetical protein
MADQCGLQSLGVQQSRIDAPVGGVSGAAGRCGSGSFANARALVRNARNGVAIMGAFGKRARVCEGLRERGPLAES